MPRSPPPPAHTHTPPFIPRFIIRSIKSEPCNWLGPFSGRIINRVIMLHVGSWAEAYRHWPPQCVLGYDPSPQPIGVIMCTGVKQDGVLPLSVFYFCFHWKLDINGSWKISTCVRYRWASPDPPDKSLFIIDCVGTGGAWKKKNKKEPSQVLLLYLYFTIWAAVTDTGM